MEKIKNPDDVQTYYIKRQLIDAYLAALMFGNLDIAEICKRRFKQLQNN